MDYDTDFGSKEEADLWQQVLLAMARSGTQEFRTCREFADEAVFAFRQRVSKLLKP